MNAALFGQTLGMFLAAGGIAYIWIGILWAIRVYKRWPQFSYWSGAILATLIGAVTAASNGEFLLTMAACLAASAYVVWRGKATLRKAADGQRAS